MKKVKTKISYILLGILLLSIHMHVFADEETDQNATVVPIGQIQANDPLLPSSVSDQKGSFGSIISKMFRTDNKKIATAFIHAFQLFMASPTVNTGRVPTWDGTSGAQNWLVPGTIRDRVPDSIVGIGGSPQVGSGTLQVNPGLQTGKVSSDKYCDEYGLNCFDPSSISGGSMGGTGVTNYIAKFTGTSTLGSSLLYDNGANVGVGISSGLTHKFTVDGNIAMTALKYLYMGSQYLYGDNSSALYYNSNHSTISQIILRDLQGTTYGRLYGSSDGTYFGLLDSDADWAIQSTKDSNIGLFVDNTAVARFYTGGVYTSPGRFEVGYYSTGNNSSYVDLRGDDTYTDFGLRMMRYNTGPNAESRISHRGTGPLVIHTNEAAPIRFYTNNTEKLRIADTGELLVGTTSISSGLKVDVEGKVGAIEYCDQNGANCFDPASIAVSGSIGGTGTQNYITKFTGTGTIGNSSIYDNGSGVGIGTTSVSSYKLNVVDNTAGGNTRVYVGNSNNTNSASSAGFLAEVGGTSAGDAFTNYRISGGAANWSTGLDNSDGDKFKISRSSTLGTNDVITIDGTADTVGIGTTTPGTSKLNVQQTGTNIAITGQSVGGQGVYGTSTSGVGVQGNSSSSAGVYGTSATGIGVQGQTSGGTQPAVYGTASAGAGVQGISVSTVGVQGQSTSSSGVYGTSATGIGVTGQTTGGTQPGVYGTASAGIGVQGASTSSQGVYGGSTSSYGVQGSSSGNIGVVGQSTGAFAGVYGTSATGMGVHGNSTSNYGVYGASTSNYGVFGNSTDQAGVYGQSTNEYGIIGKTLINTRGGVYGANFDGSAYGILGYGTNSALYGVGNAYISGKVGIGANPGTYKTTITSSTSADTLQVVSTAASGQARITLTGGASGQGQVDNAVGDFYITNAAATGDLIFRTNNTRAATILETGDVSLSTTGTVSAGLKLDVEGKVGATQYCDNNGLNCFTPGGAFISGSGTANYHPKFSGASSLVDSIVFDNGTNLGIGTTSLTQKLTVAGNIAMTSGRNLYFGNQFLYGDNGSYLFFNSNSSTYSAIRLRDLESTTYGTLYGSTDGTNFGLLDADGDWLLQHIKDSSTILSANNQTTARFYTGATYLAADRIEGSYTSYRSGNRYSYLDLTGDDTYTDFGLRMMRYNTGPNAESRISHRGTGPLVIHTNEAAPIRFYNNNTESGRFTETGSLLVGTTSPSNGLKLDVEGKVGATQFCDENGLNCFTTSTVAGGIGGSGTTNYVTKFTGAGTIGDSQIQDNGTAVGVGTAPNNSYKLNVGGDVLVNSNRINFSYASSTPGSGPALKWSDGGNTNVLGLYVNGGLNFQGNSSNSAFRIRTPTTNGTLGTQVVHLGGASTTDNSWINAGNVGIGTTNPGTTRLNVQQTGANTAVLGQTVSGVGVQGTSSSNSGVYGTSTTGVGVTGSTTGGTQPGVYGSASAGVGVQGASTSSQGVYGSSTSGYGVQGVASGNIGVVGQSTGAFAGVYGTSASGIGAQGNSTSSYGVYGSSSTTHGVYGNSTSGYGTYGQSSGNYGVVGRTTNASYGGVLGYNTDASAYGVLGYGANYALYGSGNAYISGGVGIGATPNGTDKVYIENSNGVSLNLTATDGGGAPASATLLKLKGFEDRGKGIKITDEDDTNEWFIGEGYDYQGIGIGLVTSGTQSEYGANAKFFVNTSGNIGVGTVSPSAGLKLDVEGKVGATEYCDNSGANCFLASSVAGGLTGAGTTNYIPKYTGANTFGDSSIFDNGTSVGIGTTTPGATNKLAVIGDVDISDQLAVGANANTVTNAVVNIGQNHNVDANTYQLYSVTTQTSPALNTAARWSYGNYTSLINNKTIGTYGSYATANYGYTQTTGTNTFTINSGGIFEARNAGTGGGTGLYGVQATARQQDNAGASNVTTVAGLYGEALGNSSTLSSSTIATSYGVYGFANPYRSNVTNQYGVYGYSQTSSSYEGDVGTSYGVRGINYNSSTSVSSTMTNGYGGYFESYKSAGASTMSKSTGILSTAAGGVNTYAGEFYATNANATNNYGIYIDARNATGTNYGIHGAYGDWYLQNGDMGIGDPTPDGTLRLDVEGQVGATQYCDQNGTNCFTPSSGIGAPSGTTNYVTKFSSANTLGDSSIFDNGSGVGIGTATPGTYKLNVQQTGANNTAILGNSAAYYGIEGRTGSAAHGGVLGYSADLANYGILGYSNVYGVYGNATGGVGVRGVATTGEGVYGSASSGAGVYGTSATGMGVQGQTTGGTQPAVYGIATAGVGSWGASTNNYGVYGDSINSYGVVGKTGAGGYGGVLGYNNDNSAYGILGYGTWGVYGIGGGYISGNMGIGEQQPQDKLHVKGTTASVSDTQIIAEGAAAGYGAGISFLSDLASTTTNKEMAKITADGESSWNTTVSTQDAGLRFFTTLNGTLAEKARLTSNGALLVGTTSLSAGLKVDVEGNLGATQYCDQNGTNCFTAATVGSGLSGAGTTNYIPKYTAANTLGNSQVFDNGTSVGVGTTSPGTYKLNVQQTGANTAILGQTVSGVGVRGQSSSSAGVYGTSATGIGVQGQTTGGTQPAVYGIASAGVGVQGQSTSVQGVYGQSSSSTGVYGTSATGIGVQGQTTGGTQPAVYGIASAGIGVQGQSTSAQGVYGASTSNYGVQGVASGNIGVYGQSTGSYAGVYGTSVGGTGVTGQTTGGTQPGVYGSASAGIGVQGNSTSNYGVYGVSTSNYGVYGASTSQYGVYGQSSGNYGITGRTTNATYGGILGYNHDATAYGILGYGTNYALYGSGDMYLTGKAGIGAVPGSFKFAVTSAGSADTLLVQSTAASGQANISLQGGAGGLGQIQNNVGDMYITNVSTTGDMILRTNSTRAATILETGDVSLSTTGTVSAGLKLDVEGKVGATEYCDNNGANCFTPSTVGSGLIGSGTANYTARFTAANTLGIGVIQDNGTNVGIGGAPSTSKLDVAGDTNVQRLLVKSNNAATTSDIDLTGDSVVSTEGNLNIIADSDNNATNSSIIFGTNAVGTTGMNEIMRASDNGSLDVSGQFAAGANGTITANTVSRIQQNFNTDATTYQYYSAPVITSPALSANRYSYGDYMSLTNNKDKGTGNSYATAHYGYVNTSGTVAFTANYGSQFEARNSSTGGGGTLTGVQGVGRQYDNSGSSNVTSVIGVEGDAYGNSSTLSSSTISNSYALYGVANPFRSDVTNQYGVYGYSQTTGTYEGDVGTSYGVRGISYNSSTSASSTMPNSFGGDFLSYKSAGATTMTSSVGVRADARGGINTYAGQFYATSADATNNFGLYIDVRNGTGTNYGIQGAYGDWYLQNGDMGIGDPTPDGTLRLDVAGNIGATQYCDDAGNNCFSASSIAGGTIGGSGTANYIPKFTAGTTLGNSSIFDNGTSVGVGVGTPVAAYKLDVNGPIRSRTGIRVSPTGTAGSLGINPGNGARTGYIGWYAPAADGTDGTRYGYMGWDSTANIGLNLENGANFTIAGGNVGIGGAAAADRKLGVAQTGNNYAIVGTTTGVQTAIYGESTNYYGVTGRTLNASYGGVLGYNSDATAYGILGYAVYGLFAFSPNNIGVYGQSTNSYGTYGQSAGNYGVVGRTTSASHGGVLGYNSDATKYGILGHLNRYALYGVGDIYTSGDVVTGREGTAGTYNAAQVQGVWSIGDAYRVDTTANDFGTQYGIVYAHTNAGTAAMGGKLPIAGQGHQLLFTSAGATTSMISLTTGNADFNMVNATCIGACF